MRVKQVIVMRHDLGMRRGKQIAQGSHASIAFLTNRLRCSLFKLLYLVLSGKLLSKTEWSWITSSFTKVCVRVDSEAELLAVYNKAVEAGLEAHLITDSGKTEFNGVPTKTCLAIGPDVANKIDQITGNLKLL